MTPRAWSMTLVLACVVAARADEPPGVRYRDDRLTVRLTATPRNEVLIDVAQATGAAVRGRLEDADTPVTASFDALPLDEALRRLLPKQAFALKYDGDRVAAIELLDASGAVLPPPARGVVRAPGETAQEAGVRAALGALAVARENGMTSGDSNPLEAIVGRGREGEAP
jgi:hypothetical protein